MREPAPSDRDVPGGECSALAVPLPGVDLVVRPWRERFDPSARAGIPAHVTLLVPFLPPERIDRTVLAAIREEAAPILPFDVTFRSTRRFPDALCLDPEPSEPFRDLTRALVERWPECPPYGGAYPDPTPHLTLAFEQSEVTFARVAREVEPHLPVRARAAAVALYAGSSAAGWRVVATIPFPD